MHAIGETIQWWMFYGWLDQPVMAHLYPDPVILPKIVASMGGAPIEELWELLRRLQQRGQLPFARNGPYNGQW